MSRFDMDHAQEAMEAARVERARLVVSAFAWALEQLARLLRGMAARAGSQDHGPQLA
jgi:hypothetical protein